MSEITLVVLQHGLWGKGSHMSYIERSIRERMKDTSVVVLNSDVNQGKYTYDGIDLCGKRLAEKIRSHVTDLAKEGRIVKKLGIVGYSLGGLMARYAIGILDKDGFFNYIKPGFFVTFATPHMGVRRPKNSLISRLFNFFSSIMVSRTGEQLQLTDSFKDGIPLLVILASPDQPYYQAIQKFDIMRTYANIKNDRTVPYWSSALMTTNYFNNLKTLDLAIDRDYPSIVTGYDVADPSKKKTNRKRSSCLSKLRKIIFYLLVPILLPFIATFGFAYIGIQGILSRFRVSKILKASLLSSTSETASSTLPPATSTTSTEYILTGTSMDKRSSTHVLSGTLDAMNMTPNPDDTIEHTVIHQQGAWCNIMPPESLEKQSAGFQFDSQVLDVQRNLSQLPWQIVLVCLHSFNAHGSIICRQGIHTTHGGKAVVKHFLDTVPM
ncbi:putative serine esterase-domain-containing protein [Absidia repens]|uniref:Putative serine esterase-domain-containing protein n=1 Tax=Absidia repens TaxID=90262 RepID=A0A1X2J0F5_9FUNG|nr:putative serine esterase-domain-containing protein [Absidia repens]